jgi:multidrug efflux pump subunit AcrB
VNHQGPFSAVTLSFNLPPGVALGDAVTAINQANRKSAFRKRFAAAFQGTAQAYQSRWPTNRS